jgi:hypothetical protein
MPNTKQIAAVVHELVAAQLFDDWVGLSEAVKGRCATLRIGYDSGSITDAVKLVERSRPVFVQTRRPVRNPQHVERDDDARPLSRHEAADLYARLVTAVQREHEKGRRRA